MKEKIKRCIALISDMHVGSIYSLFPNDFTDVHGINISAARNKDQITLYDYWLDFIAQCQKQEIDTVFLLGDLVHGTQRRDYGRDLLSNLDEQKRAAIELLKPICNKKIVAGISGSPYHESLDTKIHRDIIEYFGGTFLDSVGNIKLKDLDFVVNISHGASGAFIYRATILDREAVFLKSAEALNKLPKIDIIIRGHWHQYIYINYAEQHFIQLPCWITFFPYVGTLKLYPKFQPDIGAVILEISSEGGKKDVRVKPYLYPVLHIADPLVQV